MLEKLNLFTPQWQGSGLTKELYYGALSLKEYIENTGVSFNTIPVSMDTDLEVEFDILGYRVIVDQLKKVAEEIKKKDPSKIFTIGGGCGVEIPVVSYLSKKYSDLDVLWFDAHGDLNSPKSSPSKHFHGMPLRFLLDDIGIRDISALSARINSDRLTLFGVRDLDRPEKDFIKKKSIRVLNSSKKDELLNSIKGNNVYLHIDLDVLDPNDYKNVKCPTKNGIKIKDLSDLIKTIYKDKNIVGMSILENTERKRDKLKLLDELINIGLNI